MVLRLRGRFSDKEWGALQKIARDKNTSVTNLIRILVLKEYSGDNLCEGCEGVVVTKTRDIEIPLDEVTISSIRCKASIMSVAPSEHIAWKVREMILGVSEGNSD